MNGGPATARLCTAAVFCFPPPTRVAAPRARWSTWQAGRPPHPSQAPPRPTWHRRATTRAASRPPRAAPALAAARRCAPPRPPPPPATAGLPLPLPRSAFPLRPSTLSCPSVAAARVVAQGRLACLAGGVPAAAAVRRRSYACGPPPYFPSPSPGFPLVSPPLSPSSNWSFPSPFFLLTRPRYRARHGRRCRRR